MFEGLVAYKPVACKKSLLKKMFYFDQKADLNHSFPMHLSLPPENTRKP